MDDNTTLKLGLFTILLVGFIAVCLSINERDKPIVAMSKEKYETKIRKIDSLNQVIDSLQMEIFYLEDGFDDKEHRYEQALYDCEHRRRLRRQKHKGQLKQQFRYE
jgi:hypothetical protein